MPFYTDVARPRAIDWSEWVTPGGIVLTVAGDLDAMGCRALEQHLRRLVARWPGLLLTLDLERVTRVDGVAVEGLVLAVVAMRAGEARLPIAARGGPCRAVLQRLGLAADTPPPPGASRWPSMTATDAPLWAGVTA